MPKRKPPLRLGVSTIDANAPKTIDANVPKTIDANVPKTIDANVPKTIDANAYYTPETLADVIGVGRKAVSLLCTQGEMGHIRINKQLVIPGAEAIECLRNRTAKAQAKKGAAS